ncbi:MAG: putative Zn-dependent protease containing repeat [Gemmatimonadetes bacterium]|nr:putative Zn-dependent protease containing repeat [Gemmatimonadota bacterium]
MRTRIAAGFVALAALLSASTAGAQLRDRLARAAGAAVVSRAPIGPAKEIEIGRNIASTLAGRYHVVHDTALVGYVNLVGQVVARMSPRANEITFRFDVLDSDDVNAFAAPGGYVFVTRGALAMMQSEAELAGVLAHEIGHVDAKHVLEKIQRADMLKSVRQEADLTGPLLDQVADLGAGAIFTGFDRREEMEADSLGQVYAAAAGYRSNGLATFLTRLHEGEQGRGAASGLRARLARTHPDLDVRLTALQRQAAAAQLDPAAGEALADRFHARMRVAPRAAARH